MSKLLFMTSQSLPGWKFDNDVVITTIHLRWSPVGISGYVIMFWVHCASFGTFIFYNIECADPKNGQPKKIYTSKALLRTQFKVIKSKTEPFNISFFKIGYLRV